MADFNSVQFAKQIADPNLGVHVNEWGGRVRAYWFEYTSLGTEADTETIALVRLPKGARLLDGLLVHGAHTGADLLIGTEADPDRYLTTADIALDGTVEFLRTAANFFGEVLTETTDVIATVDTATLTVGEILNGYILAVVD